MRSPWGVQDCQAVRRDPVVRQGRSVMEARDIRAAHSGSDPSRESASQPQSTAFDRRVQTIVARIPPGRLVTYGQIAELIGAWGHARQVGWALRRLQLNTAIPWHRVVNARGCISMNASREGSDWIQRQRLLEEGIPVDAEGRLPLRSHQWRPDPSDLSVPYDRSDLSPLCGPSDPSGSPDLSGLSQ